MKRILVTGSRRWTDVDKVHYTLESWMDAIAEPQEEVILVHGECHLGGADIIARDYWLSKGRKDEPHPADWETYGKGAGFVRNGEMVDLGADLCIAFILPDSNGTIDCLNRAIMAGIKTVQVYGPMALQYAEKVVKNAPSDEAGFDL